MEMKKMKVRCLNCGRKYNMTAKTAACPYCGFLEETFRHIDRYM